MLVLPKKIKLITLRDTFNMFIVLTTVLFCLLFNPIRAQQDSMAVQIDQYLHQIRHNTAQLRAFFQQMPKGGDLHHHYSGSVYAETYLETIEEDDLFVHTRNFTVDSIAVDSIQCKKVSYLKQQGLWLRIREKLIQKWSIKDYNCCQATAPDQHFFSSFVHFNIPANKQFKKGLLELKNRAKLEHLQYIETIFLPVDYKMKASLHDRFNQQLEASYKTSSHNIRHKLDSIAPFILKDSLFLVAVTKHNALVDSLHLGIDDKQFMLRYQNFVLRVLPPIDVFKSLLAAFASAARSKWIVGVNIVAPEHHPVSMRDYGLHMEMFSFCAALYPTVRYALHAGELTLGMVPPEELSWHVEAAVEVAGAHRIGHGVDIMYEANRRRVLQTMKEKKIAVEINLTSNEFILGVKSYAHPIILYKNARVPIVISSDDAGGFRSDLTQQYVLLAHRYAEFSYHDIKKIIFNGIEYSFLDNDSKQNLSRQLLLDFEQFEKNCLAEIYGK